MVGQTWKGSIEEIQPYEWYSNHLINNKRYTKIDEYKTLLTGENNIESIEYKERLIDYDEDYKSYNPYLDWDGSETFY